VGTPASTVIPPSVAAPISASLETALARVLATVPPGRRGAVVADLSLQGARVEVAQKLAENWTVAAYGAYWWQTADREAGVRVKGSW
jgi:hypothetical protein